MNRFTLTFKDNIKESNTHVIGTPEGKESENGTEKNVWKNNGWDLPKFGGLHKFTDSRSQAKLKLDIYKEIHTKNIMVKLLKTKDKEKILKATRENDIIQIGWVGEGIWFRNNEGWRIAELNF